jgi:signal transduction histidine kinase
MTAKLKLVNPFGHVLVDAIRDTLIRNLSRTNRVQELERRIAQLEQYQAMQHAVTQIIAQATDTERAISDILQALCGTLGWDFAEVWYLVRETGELTCRTSWHQPSLSFPAFTRSTQDVTFVPGKGLPGKVWASGKPTWIKDVVVDAEFLRRSVAKHDGLHAGLGIPIHTEGKMIGVMTFFSRDVRNSNRDLLRVLNTVGSQIGLFIERKRSESAEQAQARKLAAVEERQRLARDLHDSVTQTLFSASVIAEMLPQLWDKSPEKVRVGVDDLQQLTKNALDEMRTLLVQMRPEAAEQCDLAEKLNTLADSIMKRSKLQLHLNIDGYEQLSSEAQMAFFRITQEALNNVVKHAAATQVWIKLHVENGQVELHIQDNGRGFKPESRRDGHFGLSIMRERAEEIGARLQVASKPGQGTHMTVIGLCA